MKRSEAIAVRFALIGCGFAGRLRAEALRRCPGLTLDALHDRAPERAAELASRTGARILADWRDALEPAVDALIVATPPDRHAEVAGAALAAGRHVLCEKPLARSSREAAPLVAAATESGVHLATGFNFRFFPPMRDAHRLLLEGRLGELVSADAFAGYDGREAKPPWVREARVTGGGTLRDNGIHLIDLTCWLIGGVDSASGRASSAALGIPGCEDHGRLELVGRGGCQATVEATWVEPRGYRFSVVLRGDRGELAATCFPMRLEARWSEGGRRRRRIRRYPGAFLREHLLGYEALLVESFARELTAFAEAARGGPGGGASGLDGLRALQIAEAARPA